MPIDRDQPIPIYFQLKTLLLEAILSGRYGPGERLPTEHELCDEHEISRTPVSRALSELAEEGVVIRHRRRGSFVNPHWLTARADSPELRVVVPEGPWEEVLRANTPDDLRINVVSVALPDLHQTLTHAVAEGRAPDLAVVDTVWVAELASAGFLWPLEDLDDGWLGHELHEDFFDPFRVANRFEEATYAVFAEADVAGLWYRRDALDRVGAPPPTTWDELGELATALGPGDGAAPALALPGGSRAGETTTYCLLGLLGANGVRVLGPRSVTLGGPGTVEGLRFLRGLVESGVLSMEVVGYEWDRPIRLLAQGHAALSLGGSYEARLLAEATGRALDELWDTFGFARMPSGPRGSGSSLVGGMGYAIFRQAARPKDAMRLLRHAVSTDALADMSRATAQIPPRRSAVDRVVADAPFVGTTAAMLRNAVVRPSTPAYARVSAQLQAMLEAVLTGRLGPAAAAERTTDMIAAITGLPVDPNNRS